LGAFLRSLRRIALASTASVAAVVLATAPAFAGDGATSSITGASVWFTASGDVVSVKDTYSDGHSAVGQVQIPSAGIYENLWNPDGTGTTRSKSYGTSVAEGVGIWYRACTGEYGTGEIIRCDTTWYYTTTD
jgi:hypothetical protein